jgi:uncharacterized membrane protein
LKNKVGPTIWIITLLSFIGFLDASYLTASHYGATELACGLSGGCDTVTTSEYSTVFGIPVALGGALFYFSVLIFSLLFIDTKNKKFLLPIVFLTPLGFLSSVWFVYLQLYVIEAICYYCMGSATTSTLLFLLTPLLWQKLKHQLTP